jgi:hypothetical protein
MLMLKLLRRILTIIGIVLIMLVVTLFLAAPQIIVDLATRLYESSPALRAMQVLAALLIDALLITVIYRIIRPPLDPGLVVHARGAKAKVSTDSVQRQINARIAQVSDILDVQAEVEVEGSAARVTLNIRTRPDINVPEKQREVSRILRQLVEKQMGLKLAGLAVIHMTLATDEYTSGDQVTTVVDPVAEPQYTAAYEELDSGTPARNALPAQASRPREKEGEEPWRAFLLGDDSN